MGLIHAWQVIHAVKVSKGARIPVIRFRGPLRDHGNGIFWRAFERAHHDDNPFILLDVSQGFGISFRIIQISCLLGARHSKTVHAFG